MRSRNLSFRSLFSQLMVVCLVLVVTPAFAQNWQTSFVQTHFVSGVTVSNSSTTEQVTLSGELAAVVQVQSPQNPCQRTAPCTSVPIRVFYAAIASGVGQSTGATYRAFSASSSKGTFTMPGTFAWQIGLRVTPPNPIVPPNPITVLAATNVNSQGTATAATMPPSGLVSWWQAEGNALDALGQNNGTLSEGVNFVPGRVGLAFDFAPTPNQVGPIPFVEAGPSPSLQPPAITVTAWVNNSFSPIQAYVVSQGAHECIAASYALYTGVGNNLTFYIWDGAQIVFSPNAGPELWDGNWHFVAGTYDGAAVRLYVDGVQVGSGTPTSTVINYAGMDNDRFYIGAYHGIIAAGGCDLGFPGAVDEVKVFNRALTSAEIQSIYQNTP